MPTDAQIEAKAREIYLARYAKEGGRWEAVETKEVWHKMARDAWSPTDEYGATGFDADHRAEG